MVFALLFLVSFGGYTYLHACGGFSECCSEVSPAFPSQVVCSLLYSPTLKTETNLSAKSDRFNASSEGLPILVNAPSPSGTAKSNRVRDDQVAD